MNAKKLAKKFKANWKSPIVTKKAIPEFTGGMFAVQTITNLITQGKGPRPFYIRGRCVFDVDEFLVWLLQHISDDYEGFEIKKHTPHYKG